jgi:3',5'-cyclic AMP phosphodiesterase CpdA
VSDRTQARIVHLSDLHIRSDLCKANDFDDSLDQAGLRTHNLVAYINNNHPDAHVVITGDITDSGTSTSLRVAKDLLGRWFHPRRLSVVLGNHDCGSYGNRYLPERVREFKRTFNQTVDGGLRFPWIKFQQPLAILGLDSTAGANETALARGRLGDEQIDWLTARVAQLPPVWIPVVLLHHDPFDSDFSTSLVDAERFRRCISRHLHGRPSVVLFGHKHSSSIYPRAGATYFQAPSSVSVDRNRLRFRVLTIGYAGVKASWDGCRVPRT